MKMKMVHGTARWLVLTPVMLWLLVSCSATPRQIELDSAMGDDWNASVAKTIAEPQRAARLKQLGAELLAVSNSIQQDIQTLDKNLMNLNENYAASHEQYEQMVEVFSQQRKPKFDRYRDIIFAMRGEVSAAEWKALTK